MYSKKTQGPDFTFFFPHPLYALTINQMALPQVTCQASVGHTVYIENLKQPHWISGKHSLWRIHHKRIYLHFFFKSLNVPSKLSLLNHQKASLQMWLQVWLGQLRPCMPISPLWNLQATSQQAHQYLPRPGLGSAPPPAGKWPITPPAPNKLEGKACQQHKEHGNWRAGKMS